MIQIIKASQLPPKLLRRLQQLVGACHQYDGYLTKFYWHSSENRSNKELSDFVYLFDNKPVGYMALYQFSEDEAEISSVVHPEFRRQGIFHRLWMEATLELIQRGVKRAMFIAHSDANAADICLKSLAARYYRSELRMVLYRSIHLTDAALPDMTLRPATDVDLSVMAKIDEATFGGNYQVLYDHLAMVLEEPKRQIFLAESQGKVVGKIHVLYESEALMHDLSVAPEYQNQGYRKQIVINAANQILAMGYASVAIEVASDDFSLVRLYRSLGFKKVCSYKYWMSQVEQEQEPNYMVLH